MKKELYRSNRNNFAIYMEPAPDNKAVRFTIEDFYGNIYYDVETDIDELSTDDIVEITADDFVFDSYDGACMIADYVERNGSLSYEMAEYLMRISHELDR